MYIFVLFFYQFIKTVFYPICFSSHLCVLFLRLLAEFVRMPLARQSPVCLKIRRFCLRNALRTTYCLTVLVLNNLFKTVYKLHKPQFCLLTILLLDYQLCTKVKIINYVGKIGLIKDTVFSMYCT
jgi:hypothetical protein